MSSTYFTEYPPPPIRYNIIDIKLFTSTAFSLFFTTQGIY